MSAGPVETYRGGVHLTTTHEPAAYSDVQAVQVGAWRYAVLVPEDGRTFTALGGERLLPYETARGARAEGFTLRPGDRVTRLRSDLPSSFAEWRIERAGGGQRG